MDAKLWIGLLVFLLVVANGISIIKRGRKSGKVQSYGHPWEDIFLLISSALILIGVMAIIFLLLGARVPEKGSSGKYLIILVTVMAGSGLAFASNRILRHKPRGKRYK